MVSPVVRIAVNLVPDDERLSRRHMGVRSEKRRLLGLVVTQSGSHDPIFGLFPQLMQWAMQGLNLRPLPCQGSALPLS